MKQVQDLRLLSALAGAEQAQWASLCDQLEQALAADPGVPTLVVKNQQRKWELVSAYQKTVRRGQLDLAAKLAWAMTSMVDELPYMWRRVQTTVCEDVGAANPLLMNWVIALGTVMTPSIMRPVFGQIMQLVTRLMCESQKSRAYCMMSIISGQIKDGQAERLNASESGKTLRAALTTHLESTFADQALAAWVLKNNWRGDGMLIGQLQARMWPVHLLEDLHELPSSKILFGLPDYAYDMHTRVGKGTLVRLCGVPEVRQLFSQYMPKDKAQALGWAMFFEDGGRIAHELVDIDLAQLEQLVVSERHGLTMDGWWETRKTMRKILDSGIVNDKRNQLLYEQGY